MPNWMKEYKHALISVLSVAGTIIVLLVGSIYAEKAKALCKVEEKQQSTSERVTRLESQFEYIVKGIGDIKEDVKKLREEGYGKRSGNSQYGADQYRIRPDLGANGKQ
jgi:peptidoglycan hydrolase CwlO-like protein